MEKKKNPESEQNNKELGLAAIIDRTKDFLHRQVYIDLTRQIVTRQELLHGVTLSLKYFLDQDMKVFAIPLPGWPNGGRSKNWSTFLRKTRR